MLSHYEIEKLKWWQRQNYEKLLCHNYDILSNIFEILSQNDDLPKHDLFFSDVAGMCFRTVDHVFENY